MSPVGIRSIGTRKPKVVIDWSNIHTNTPHLDTEPYLGQLLSWLQAYPNTSDVQVTLQSKCNDAVGRRLQRTLQSMGCTVVTRYFSVAA